MEDVLVSGKIEYIREAIMLLLFYASDETYSSKKKEYERKNFKKSQQVLEKYDFLQEIETDFGKAIKPYEQDLSYYFGKKYSEGRNVGQVVLCANEMEDKFNNLDDIRKHWDNFKEEDYVKEFAYQIYMYNSIVWDYDEKAKKKIQPIDVIKKIMEMDIPDSEKWKLQDIFLYPEKHREKVLHLISLSLAVIQKYEKQLKKYQKEFIDYWTGILANQNIYEYIEEYIGVTLDKNEYDFEIKSSIIIPNSVSILANENDDKITGKYEISIGFLFDDDFRPMVANDDKTNQEDILNALKLLADKSKFDILTYIKDKRAYGGELAKKLDLTPATISHHMSALLAAGLVKLEKEDTKIYYIANREELEKVVNAVTQYLL